MVGCGWVPAQRRIFFTLNGRLLGTAFSGNTQVALGDDATLVPVVGARSRHVVVSANFGADGASFLWMDHTLATLADDLTAASLSGPALMLYGLAPRAAAELPLPEPHAVPLQEAL